MFIKGFEKKANNMSGGWGLNQQAAKDFSRGASRGGSFPSFSQMIQNAKNAFGGPPKAATPPPAAPSNVGHMGG